MKVAVPLAKNNLVSLGITAASSTIDTGIQKKIHGSGTTTLIIKWWTKWHNGNCSSSCRF